MTTANTMNTMTTANKMNTMTATTMMTASNRRSRSRMTDLLPPPSLLQVPPRESTRFWSGVSLAHSLPRTSLGGPCRFQRCCCLSSKLSQCRSRLLRRPLPALPTAQSYSLRNISTNGHRVLDGQSLTSAIADG